MSVIQTIDYAAIAPPLILALTALVVLVADLFIPRHRRGAVLGATSIAGVLVALVATVARRTRRTKDVRRSAMVRPHISSGCRTAW